MVVVGSLVNMPLAWNLGNFFMGLMAIVNILIILFMLKPANILLKDYEKQLKQKIEPTYNIDRTPELKTSFYNMLE